MRAVDITTWLPVADAETDVLQLLPAGYEDLKALYDGLWERDVDAVTLELCRLRVATLICSAADLSARDPRAIDAGLTEELVAALPAWPTSPLFTEAQRAALAFVEQYVMDAHGFTDDDAVEMHRHFTEPQLATLMIAVATFDALCRVRSLLSAGATDTSLPVQPARAAVAL